VDQHVESRLNFSVRVISQAKQKHLPAVSRRLRRRDTERCGELITIQANVVDARFAGLNTIYYLLKILVFDLQSIADQ